MDPPKWPIVRDSRRHVVWTALVSGAVATLFMTLVLLAPASGQQRPTLKVAAVVYGVAAFMTFMAALTSGRTRLTPSAVLRVPVFGRTRWVAFADLTRVRVGSTMLSLDADGRVWTFDWDQVARGRKRRHAVRELMRGWLSSDFDITLRPSVGPTASTAAQKVFGFVLVGGTFLVLNLARQPFVRAAHAIAPSTQHAGHRLFTFSFAVLVPVLCWIVVVLVVKWLVTLVFGIDFSGTEGWARRRSKGHGFEPRLLEDVSAV